MIPRFDDSLDRRLFNNVIESRRKEAFFRGRILNVCYASMTLQRQIETLGITSMMSEIEIFLMLDVGEDPPRINEQIRMDGDIYLISNKTSYKTAPGCWIVSIGKR